MSKMKIIQIAIGAVTLLAVAGLSYLIYDAIAAEGEANDELNGIMESGQRLVRAPVFPGAPSVKALESNRTAYAEWRAEALAAVSRGDRLYAPTTPAAFKQEMVAEARRLSALPGAADGKLVKPEFPFGFKAYIVDGQLPPEKDLPRLQREWGDVLTVVNELVKAGVSELTEVAVRAADASGAEAQASDGSSPGGEVKPAKKPAKKTAKKGKKGAKGKNARVETDGEEPDVTKLSVEFRARPAAFTAAVNALAETDRFVVVNDLRFVRETDELQEKLGAAAEKKTEAAGRSRRRGRLTEKEKKAEAEKAAAEAEKKKGFVTDPITAPLLKVRLDISVCDFRTAAAKAEAAAEEAAQAAAGNSEGAPAEGAKEEAK